MYSLNAFFGDVHDLAVWDIAINDDNLIRHQWPDSLIADHALYLYMFQQQRIQNSMDRDPRLPDVDLRDFSYHAIDGHRTYWYNPSFGYIALSAVGLVDVPRLLLYPRTTGAFKSSVTIVTATE